MRINGTLYYMLKDHLGSASVVTDSAGNIVGEQRYYPFGETRLSTGTLYTDKLFTGQRNIAGLGIYHYQSRFYSPKLGRFLSADTIVPNPFHPQDFNRFAYVRNNPVRYVDPSGHVCSDPEDETPTCDSSPLLTTKVGNKVVRGTGLDAGKPKVVKKNKTEDKKNDPPSALILPDGGLPDPDAPVVIANPDPLDGGLQQDDPTPPFIPEPPEGHPPCRDAEDCEGFIVLMALELAHLLAFDILMLMLIGVAIPAGPEAWLGVVILIPVIWAFYAETWNTIQHIQEAYEWRDYYNETAP